MFECTPLMRAGLSCRTMPSRFIDGGPILGPGTSVRSGARPCALLGGTWQRIIGRPDEKCLSDGTSDDVSAARSVPPLGARVRTLASSWQGARPSYVST